jgi:hypothetical protein
MKILSILLFLLINNAYAGNRTIVISTSPYKTATYVDEIRTDQSILVSTAISVREGQNASTITANGFYGNEVKASSINITGTGVSGSNPLLSIADSAMVVLNNGNVGIGTTNPVEKLQVYSGNIMVGNGSNFYPLIQPGREPTVGNVGYSFYGDNDTGFYHPNLQNVLGFVTGGVERVRIDNVGNVGIGTINPQANLSINANTSNAYALTIDTNDNPSDGYLVSVDTTGNSIFVNAQLTANDGTGNLILRNYGGLRVEQTYPKAKAHIDWGDSSLTLSRNLELRGIETTTTVANEYWVLDDTTTTGSVLEIGKAGIQGYVAANGQTSSVSSRKMFSFAYYPTQGDSWANLTSSITISNFFTNMRPANNLTILSTVFEASSPDLGQIGGGLGIYNVDRQYGLQIGIQDNGDAFLQEGRIDSAQAYNINLNPKGGNVGIGTTSPIERLQIYSGNLMVGNGNNFYPLIQPGRDVTAGNVGYSFYGDNDTGFYHPNLQNVLGFVTEGVERVRIDSAGNVGIGTTNPTTKLYVNGGDAYIATQGNGLILRDTSGTGCHRITVTSGGTITATAVTCP